MSSFENYVDLGITLMTLIRASQGREITFGLNKVIVKGRNGVVHEIEANCNGMTLVAIECAIEAAVD